MFILFCVKQNVMLVQVDVDQCVFVSILDVIIIVSFFFLVHLFSSSSTTPLISCDIQRREKSNENPKFSFSSSCTFLCSIDWLIFVRSLCVSFSLYSACQRLKRERFDHFVYWCSHDEHRQTISKHKKSYTSHEKTVNCSFHSFVFPLFSSIRLLSVFPLFLLFFFCVFFLPFFSMHIEKNIMKSTRVWTNIFILSTWRDDKSSLKEQKTLDRSRRLRIFIKNVANETLPSIFFVFLFSFDLFFTLDNHYDTIEATFITS